MRILLGDVAEVVLPLQEQKDEMRVFIMKRNRGEDNYVYGNYPGYYGYRLGRGCVGRPLEDPRIGFFKKEWVADRDCLDIGCNNGNVTIAVAVKYGCKSMLGVDIDDKLISKARKNLQLNWENGRSIVQDNRNLDEKPEIGRVNSRTEDAEVFTQNVDIGKSEGAPPTSEHTNLLRGIKFRTQNYLEGGIKFEAYDTIFCLSISKWIHLNWGDQGLISFFSKIYKELRPGGVLILEPQPWKSYASKRKISDVTSQNFKDVMLRPAHFPNLLTDKIGFRSFEEISPQLPSRRDGFSRPLFAYYK